MGGVGRDGCRDCGTALPACVKDAVPVSMGRCARQRQVGHTGERWGHGGLKRGEMAQ